MSNLPNSRPFNEDILQRGGYVYTTHQTLSSRMATGRSLELILETDVFAGKAVLDVGCGDGFFTLQLWDAGKPRRMSGLDGAQQAVKLANERQGSRSIRFHAGDGHRLPFADNTFDLALLQSVLHHDDRPDHLIRECFRVARQILIHEPNGYNPGLKLIEKVSPYHRAHGEKSYPAARMRRWIEQAGGKTTLTRFAGFVPMFCPDRLAVWMKRMEPAVERSPWLQAWLCSVVVIVGTRDGLPPGSG